MIWIGSQPFTSENDLTLQKSREQCNSILILLTKDGCCLAWIYVVVVISFFILLSVQSDIGGNFICRNFNTILKLKHTFMQKNKVAPHMLMKKILE